MTTGSDDSSRRDEATLAPYFAAARRSEPAPPRALLSAILADAGEVSAARAAQLAVSSEPPSRPRAAAARPRRGLLAALGGWQVAATLVAASAFGFWIGLSGTVELGGGAGLTASAETQGDPVAGFFDLASAE